MLILRLLVRMLVCALCVGALVVAAGCNKTITAETARKNLSPNLNRMALTREQRLNKHAWTADIERRQLEDDVDNILMIDRPGRLTRYPVP